MSCSDGPPHGRTIAGHARISSTCTYGCLAFGQTCCSLPRHQASPMVRRMLRRGRLWDMRAEARGQDGEHSHCGEALTWATFPCATHVCSVHCSSVLNP